MADMVIAKPTPGATGWNTAVDAVIDQVNALAPVATSGAKGDVGLGSVDNTADASKPVSAAQQAALNQKAPLASPTFTGTVAGVTAAMVGLGSASNTADTAKPVSAAQQAALDLKAPLASPTFTGTIGGVTKAHVGLGSVDNTADTAKPVSTATRTAVDAAQAASGPISVNRVGNDLLVRSVFSATQDLLMPVTLSGGLESMVQLATTANPFVTLVPTGASSGGISIHNPGDDNAPINSGWSYIGGNHGWNVGSLITGTHNKTSADLGSQWTDGTRVYTLLRINSSTSLLFGGPYTVASGVVTGNLIIPAATLTHVSGATNTSDVPVTGVTLVTINPSSTAHEVTVQLDGHELPAGQSAGQVLTITESYLITSFKSLIDTARANIGTSVFTIMAGVGSYARVSNTYRVTRGQVVVSQRVVALEATNLNMGVTQMLPLVLPSGGSIKQFMAGVGTAGGVNFSTLANITGITADTDITSAAYLSAFEPAHRMVQWAYDGSSAPQYGVSIGILPTADGMPAQRVKNTATKSWLIVAATKKNYPQLVWAKPMVIGDAVSGTAHRTYLAPPDTTTLITSTDGTETWMSLDQVATTTGSRVAAPHLLGKRLVPIGTPAVAVPERVAAEGITYSIAASPGYGRWKVVNEDGRLETIPGATSVPGRYFILQQGIVTGLPLTGTSQVQYFFPMYLPDATPIDRACLEVTVVGTGVIRHGIYTNDPKTGQPLFAGPLVDFGTVDPTVIGVKESTASVTLPGGWHWYSYCWQGTSTTAPTIRAITVGSGIGPLDIGTTSAPMSGSRLGYYLAAVTGAFGPLANLITHQVNAPRVAYRRA